MSKPRIKFKALVYEFHRDYEIYTGTSHEIAEQLNVGISVISTHGAKIGTRWAKLKHVDNLTGEVFYGNIEEVAMHAEIRTTYVTALVNGTQKQKRHSIVFTGQYITELYNDVKPGVVKPKTDYTSIKAVHTVKPVKMSAYWKEVFYSQFKGW